MATLESFRSAMPRWRESVDAWLDQQPSWFRNDPAWASSVYVLAGPALARLGVPSLIDLERQRIDWATILARTAHASRAERALAEAAYHLACDDPGPALGLMLVFPYDESFAWAHAGGVLYEIIAQRRVAHPLVG